MEEVTPFIIISPLSFSPEGEMQITLIRVLFQTSVHRRRLMDTISHRFIYPYFFSPTISLALSRAILMWLQMFSSPTDS